MDCYCFKNMSAQILAANADKYFLTAQKSQQRIHAKVLQKRTIQKMTEAKT